MGPPCAGTLVLCLLMWHAMALERELTINIDPRKEDCFYQPVKAGESIDIEYQVIDGGHGDLDITFHLLDPNNRVIVADYKKSENNHRAEASLTGDYRFCFDNTFSSYNTKTVFFELSIDNDDDEDDEGNMDFAQGLRGEEVYAMTVQEIQDVINNVRQHLGRVRHLQELMKSAEARDRNIAEENFWKVNAFSIIQVAIMLVVGLTQVAMIKLLFDEKSSIHRLMKSFSSNR